MGGHNSGGHNNKGRVLVGQVPFVDGTLIKRAGTTPGTTIEIKWPDLHLTALVSCRWQDGAEVLIRVDNGNAGQRSFCGFFRAAPYFGGLDIYLVCPMCRSKRRRLYVVSQRISCRCCAQLKYRSQRLRPDDRLFERARKAERELMGNREVKPKWMRWKRYQRLLSDLTNADQAFLERAKSFLRRIK